MTIKEFKAIRKRLGFSQQEFGLILLYSKKNARGRVWEIESGKRKRIPPARIQLIFNYMERKDISKDPFASVDV